MAKPFQNTDVDQVAEQLTATPTPVAYGTLIKAHPDNTNKVYVGQSDVTTSSGYPLSAGNEIFLFATLFADASDIWVIAGADNQKVCVYPM